MKKVQLTKYSQNRLKGISIKEIMNEYPDKVVDVYTEGENAILVLDTCRIKFTNTKIKGE